MSFMVSCSSDDDVLLDPALGRDQLGHGRERAAVLLHDLGHALLESGCGGDDRLPWTSGIWLDPLHEHGQPATVADEVDPLALADEQPGLQLDHVIVGTSSSAIVWTWYLPQRDLHSISPSSPTSRPANSRCVKPQRSVRDEARF
jgi:hypothetical protein